MHRHCPHRVFAICLWIGQAQECVQFASCGQSTQNVGTYPYLPTYCSIHRLLACGGRIQADGPDAIGLQMEANQTGLSAAYFGSPPSGRQNVGAGQDCGCAISEPSSGLRHDVMRRLPRAADHTHALRDSGRRRCPAAASCRASGAAPAWGAAPALARMGCNWKYAVHSGEPSAIVARTLSSSASTSFSRNSRCVLPWRLARLARARAQLVLSNRLTRFCPSFSPHAWRARYAACRSAVVFAVLMVRPD